MASGLWRAVWEGLETASVKLAQDGLWPESAIRRCLTKLPELYGWDWIEQAVTEGHPLSAYLGAWPSVRYATQFVDLISYLQANGTPEEIVQQLIKRTAPSDLSAFWSAFEELRVLWCLNRVGMPTEKLPEYLPTGVKGKKGKVQDLRSHLNGNHLYVEVTQLQWTENARRANAAWHRLTGLHMMRTMRDLKGSFWLDCRPYSPQHVAELECEMIATIDEAERVGLAVLHKPGMIKYVVWRPENAELVATLHTELKLEPESVSMPWTWHSTMSPFRVVQKINEKHLQASKYPWVLVIKASDVLPTADFAEAMVSEASEWLYDQPNLVGVVLYNHWDTWGLPVRSLPNLDTEDITVLSTDFEKQQQQQTVVLRNRYTTFRDAHQVFSKFLQVGAETGWVPTFSEPD